MTLTLHLFSVLFLLRMVSYKKRPQKHRQLEQATFEFAIWPRGPGISLRQLWQQIAPKNPQYESDLRESAAKYLCMRARLAMLLLSYCFFLASRHSRGRRILPSIDPSGLLLGADQRRVSGLCSQGGAPRLGTLVAIYPSYKLKRTTIIQIVL